MFTVENTFVFAMFSCIWTLFLKISSWVRYHFATAAGQRLRYLPSNYWLTLLRIRHFWQRKIVIFLHQCPICIVLSTIKSLRLSSIASWNLMKSTFLSGAFSWIWTLNLKISSWVLYHFATATVQRLRYLLWNYQLRINIFDSIR